LLKYAVQEAFREEHFSKKMSKIRDILEMSDEQIRLVWKDAAESLFRLRLSAQTEKLAAPSEVRKGRRTIARCQTVLNQRGSPMVAVVEDAAGTTTLPTQQKKKIKKSKKSTS